MKKRLSVLIILLLLLLAFVTAAHAQGLLDLPWWTADGGGGLSQGGAYILHGTAGQPEAAYSQGGAYTLSGGFWAGQRIIDAFEQIFLPLTLK
ncbi:MAG TPA: hypothetical protein PKM01_11440 [Anaerolineaceae bacterium]|nr:hypothetical protein [Anaerolineaceae bacterium]